MNDKVENIYAFRPIEGLRRINGLIDGIIYVLDLDGKWKT